MNKHSEESSDDQVALSFPKMPAIAREISVVVFAVAILVLGFGLVLRWLPELQMAIAFKPAVGDRFFKN
ncbi:MAG: hypothetical protein QNJ72_40710 [Pleurocapsa sp. MO_226.B13]|nr:hypothetical protein [Pleurocapsa sp. MO_226.B13]